MGVGRRACVEHTDSKTLQPITMHGSLRILTKTAKIGD